MTETQGRIVVGVDGSSHSTEALRWALRQAVLTGARVDAVACWEWPASAGGLAPYSAVDFDMGKMTRQTAQEAVAAAVSSTPGADQLDVRTTVVEGYPARVLTEAGAGADLLVVGSRGHGELSGLLLGSVGLHCATHSTCPVLIVRGTAPETA